MKFSADFHIHSKYSRATSRDMDLESLNRWAKIKGIKVLGTGDFTHRVWLKNLKEKLESAESGLYRLRKKFEIGVFCDKTTRFMLTSEISCVYTKDGKVRKIHILIFSPSFEVCDRINVQLDKIGNIDSDGRPILGLDAEKLAELVLNISPDCLIVPAHAWTPWFSIFGSKSGFDSIGECFGDYAKHIYAIETGLSSDPAMNWRLSALDKITLISNSDSHSPKKIGREANFFDTRLDYDSIISAIKSKDPSKFLFTVEFFPEEGKYHFDGHRLCGVSMAPIESRKNKNICPVCGKELTIGVLYRVEELSDRPINFKPKSAIPFKRLVPLEEIIADVLDFGAGSKAVSREYFNFISKFENEFDILLNLSESELKIAKNPEIEEAILKVRKGNVMIDPGYDGVYGKIKVVTESAANKKISQKSLL